MLDIRSIAAILVLAFSVPSLSAGEPKSENPSTSEVNAPAATTKEEIAAAILQLGSQQFETREVATQSLSRAGKGAIEPLATAATGDNLEVICRAIKALSRILDTEDESTYDAAEQALERLEESRNRSASRRAAQALQSVPVRRWKRAMARFEADGGWTVLRKMDDPNRRFLNPSLSPPAFTIPTYFVIGPGWKGGERGLSNIRRMDSVLSNERRIAVYVVDDCGLKFDSTRVIQNALRYFEFIERGKARLAVSFSFDNPNRLPTVAQIEPDAAEMTRENLKSDDILVKYDGEELVDFNHLTRLTGKHAVGDRIAAVVVRNGELVEIDVELTGWKRPAEKTDQPAVGK